MRSMLAVFFTFILFPSLSLADLTIKAEFPASIQNYIDCEQLLLGDRDTSADTVNPFYIPENRNIFSVQGYWIPLEKMTVLFDTKSAPEYAKSLYFRKNNGKSEVLFPVFPEEEEYYAELLKGAGLGPRFASTASASTRSTFGHPEGKPQQVVMNKLSVNKKMGGNIRLISKKELARSFFVTQLLRMAKGSLPKSFSYYPEPLVMIPKGMDKGGVIVRFFPPELVEGEERDVSFFSLYATPTDGSKPLLLQLAEAEGMRGQDYFREKILIPFLEQWLDLAIQGIFMEPHGQNLKLARDSKTNKIKFYRHVDFGGFSVDIGRRKRLGLPVPKPVTVNGYTVDYNEEDIGYAAASSLDLYFGSITGALGFQYTQWRKLGWVQEYTEEDHFNQMAIVELQRLFKNRTGRAIDLKGEIKNIKNYVLSLD